MSLTITRRRSRVLWNVKWILDGVLHRANWSCYNTLDDASHGVIKYLKNDIQTFLSVFKNVRLLEALATRYI